MTSTNPKTRLALLAGLVCATLGPMPRDAVAQPPEPPVRDRVSGTRAAVLIARRYTGIVPYRINEAVSSRPVRVLPPSAAIDLRPQIEDLGIAIRDQGSRGTCSVHAIAFVLEYVYTRHRHLAYRNLSEEYLNRATNLASGNAGDGDFFDQLDVGYQTHGLVTERALPYQAAYSPGATLSPTLLANGKQIPRLTARWIKTWDNETGATAAHLEKVRGRLRAGYPVAVGMWWPGESAFSTDPVGGIPLLRDVGKPLLFDGHSVALVGFLVSPEFPGGGYFVFRNSWGEGWDGGYGYASFAYVSKYANDLVSYD